MPLIWEVILGGYSFFLKSNRHISVMNKQTVSADADETIRDTL